MPDNKGAFDRFATAVDDHTSRAWFFAVCVLVVLMWAPSFPLFQDLERWQLPINTLTTVITFLLVALMQNTTRRGTMALQQKLNAIAKSLSDLMVHMTEDPEATNEMLKQDVKDLRQAVGLEDAVGTKGD